MCARDAVKTEYQQNIFASNLLNSMLINSTEEPKSYRTSLNKIEMVNKRERERNEIREDLLIWKK